MHLCAWAAGSSQGVFVEPVMQLVQDEQHRQAAYYQLYRQIRAQQEQVRDKLDGSAQDDDSAEFPELASDASQVTPQSSVADIAKVKACTVRVPCCKRGGV